MGINTVEEMGDEIKRIAPEHRKEFCDFITYGEITNELEDILDGNKEYQDVLLIAMEIEYGDFAEKIKRFKERMESRRRKRSEFWDRLFNCLGRCLCGRIFSKK